MRSLNKVMLIGNLVADPEMRSTTTGKKLVTFSLATNRDWKTETGERGHATDFHRITAWGGLGETCEKYLKKGQPVYIGGRLSNRTFLGSDGKKHYFTDVVADEVNFLSMMKKDDHEPAQVGFEELTKALS